MHVILIFSLQQQKEQAPSAPAYWEHQLCLLEGAEGTDDEANLWLCINNQIACNSFFFQHATFESFQKAF